MSYYKTQTFDWLSEETQRVFQGLKPILMCTNSAPWLSYSVEFGLLPK